MRLLIDGYNLLHCAGILAQSGGPYSLEASRVAVVKFLRSVLSDAECQRATVVFDGREAPPGLPKHTLVLGIDVRFSKRGEEADDLLEELIRQHSAPRQLTVVSSDHRVQRAAKRRRAHAIDSDVWFAQKRAEPTALPADIEKPTASAATADLEEWIEIFALSLPEPKSSASAEGSPRPDRAGTTDAVFPADYLKSLQDEVDRDDEPQD